MPAQWEEVMRDEHLIEYLQEIAKDTAFLHGVLMRTKETPNSHEISLNMTLFMNFFHTLT